MSAHLIIPHPGETLFRQSLLSISPTNVTAQDQLDRVEWLAAAGHEELARLLFGVTAVRLGFGPESLRWLAAPAERLGFDIGRHLSDEAVPLEPAFAVDLATAELARVLPLLGGRRASPLHSAVTREAVAGGIVPHRETLDTGLDAFVARVGAALEPLIGNPASGPSDPTLAHFAAAVADAARGLGPFDLRSHTGDDVERLAKLAIVNEVQAFLLIDGAIADPPFGSPGLLDAAARFSNGLGAYFSNVERLLRSVDDLFAMIRLASREATTEIDVEGWCVLLSTHFSPANLRNLATALLKRGLLDALRGVIARVEHRALFGLDRDFLWHTRDRSLEQDQVEIARDCQAVLARQAATNSIEWVILSDICAVSGDMAGVEASLSRALAIRPGDPGVEARLNAFREGTADAFARSEGFFGASERAHLRFARRT